MISIQKDVLVKALTNRIMSKVMNQLPGMEGTTPNFKVNSAVMDDLGFALEGISVHNEVGVVLTALHTSINGRVHTYMTSRPGSPAIEGMTDVECMVRGMYAFEDEDEDVEDTDDIDVFPDTDVDPEMPLEEKSEEAETGIAVMVAELIKEVVSADAGEVNDIAEKIITLSKDEADIDKDEALDDNDVFATTDKDDDDDDKDPDDDSDPFSDDSADKGDKKGKKNDDKDDKDDDKKDDDKDNDNSETDPFVDDGDEDKSSDSKDDGNVFEDGESDDKEEDDKPSSKERGEENAKVKHINLLKMSTFGLEKLMNGYEEFYPFAGLENGSFNKYAKFMADSTFADDMHTVYSEHGMESEQFVAIKDKYSSLARNVHSAAIAVTMLSAFVGVKVNTVKIKSPELFNV